MDAKHELPFFPQTQLLVEMDDRIFQPVMPPQQANLAAGQSTNTSQFSEQKQKERDINRGNKKN